MRLELGYEQTTEFPGLGGAPPLQRIRAEKVNRIVCNNI